MLLKYACYSILSSPGLLDDPRCPQCLSDAFTGLHCPNLQFIRACAGGILYGSVKRFFNVCNAWLFDTPNDRPWAIASHNFFEASQYPLMICADLRCCHCLWAYSKAQRACKCFHGQPGTVQVFLKPSGDSRNHLKRKAFQNHIRRKVFQVILHLFKAARSLANPFRGLWPLPRRSENR